VQLTLEPGSAAKLKKFYADLNQKLGLEDTTKFSKQNAKHHDIMMWDKKTLGEIYRGMGTNDCQSEQNNQTEQYIYEYEALKQKLCEALELQDPESSPKG
jgi:hypothetical protein